MRQKRQVHIGSDSASKSQISVPLQEKLLYEAKMEQVYK